MILDPCDATLVPGLYGASEGLLAKTKITFNVTPFPSAPNTAGYALWCPDFHNPKSGLSGNTFMYLTSNSATPPFNNAGAVYGAATFQPPTAQNTAFHIGDPAGALVASDIVNDARVLSACMTITFLGKMIDSAGEVCFLSNLPITQLLEGGVGSTPVSIDELFNYSASKQRLGVETLEAVYRLNTGSSDKFRDESLRPFVIAGGIATVDPASESFAPRVFGFAWRGVNPDSPISFDFVKNIEWRPEAVSGFAQAPIVNAGPGLLDAALKHADRLARDNPQVWHHVKGAAIGAAARAARNVFGGGGVRQGMGRLGREL